MSFSDENPATLDISAEISSVLESKLILVNNTDGTATLSVSEANSSTIPAGSYELKITATDSQGVSTTETITIEVVNEAPTESTAPETSATAATAFSATATYTDPENLALTITTESMATELTNILTLTDNSDNTATLAANGDDLASLPAGNYAFALNVSDGVNTQTFSYQLQLTNAAPEFVGNSTADYSLNSTVEELLVADYFSDETTTGLTFVSVESSNTTVATAAVAADATKIELSKLSAGTTTLTLVAQDAAGQQSAQASVTVTISNATAIEKITDAQNVVQVINNHIELRFPERQTPQTLKLFSISGQLIFSATGQSLSIPVNPSWQGKVYIILVETDNQLYRQRIAFR